MARVTIDISYIPPPYAHIIKELRKSIVSIAVKKRFGGDKIW
jgi:hypothetical protein